MGLAGARNSAVTGLQAQSSNISIASDNIANAATPGYKVFTGQFSTLVTSSGTSTGFSSGGVTLSAKKLVEEQGLIEATGRVSDVAISGAGFIPVQDTDGGLLLTRAGSFDINNVGQLENAGDFKLLAWPLDDNGNRPGESGNSNTTAAESVESLEVVDTNAASGTATPTSNVSVVMNLNAGQTTFQGATATIDFQSGSNNSTIAQDDIITPEGLVNIGDSFTFTSNSVSTTFDYGGFAQSYDLGEASGVFGAVASGTVFTTGTNTNGTSLADGDKFTISSTSSGTVTFTFSSSAPDTNNGEFNSLDTLATAIDRRAGLTARVVGTILYVSSVDANEALTFADVSSSNLHKELGFSSVLASSSSNTFNTLEGLATLVNAQTQIQATVNNPTSGASLEIFSSDPLQTLIVAKNTNAATVNLRSSENGENGQDDLIIPVKGLDSLTPDNTGAAGRNLVLNDGQSTAASATFTYGGVTESREISTDTDDDIFGATTTSGRFVTGGTPTLVDGDTFIITDTAGTPNVVTFTFDDVPSPDTSNGTGNFNSLDTLAEAINNYRDSGNQLFNAKVDNNKLYIGSNYNETTSSANSNLGLTFTGSNTNRIATELGVSTITAYTTSAENVGRFNTINQLRTLIESDGDFSATTISNTSANSSFVISSSQTDSDGEITILNTSDDDLVKELGLFESTSNVGDGFFTEFGLDGVVAATDEPSTAGAAPSATVAVSYDPTDVTKNMSGGNITPHFSRNITMFDSLGTGHNFRLAFLKVGTNKWSVEFHALTPSEVSAGTDGQIVNGIIQFNGDGSLQSVDSALSATNISIGWTTGASASSFTFDLGTAGSPAGTVGASVIGLTDGLRQFDSVYNVDAVEQNGVAAGQFSGIEIGDDGTISARFSNGEVKAIYQMPVITVPNQNALTAKTGNVFQASQASGEVNIKIAGQGGAGVYVPGSLEGSTSDIAEELTRTIGIQSNYNANATLISTVKQMEEQLFSRL